MKSNKSLELEYDETAVKFYFQFQLASLHVGRNFGPTMYFAHWWSLHRNGKLDVTVGRCR